MGNLGVNQVHGGLRLPHLGLSHRDLLLGRAGLQFIQRRLRSRHLCLGQVVLHLRAVELGFERERVGAHIQLSVVVLLSALQLGLRLCQYRLRCLQLQVPDALRVPPLLGVDVVPQFHLRQVCLSHLDVLLGQAHLGTGTVNLSVKREGIADRVPSVYHGLGCPVSLGLRLGQSSPCGGNLLGAWASEHTCQIGAGGC